jgi:hypothetical protein
VRDDGRDRADRGEPLRLGQLVLKRVQLRLHLGDLAEQGLVVGPFEKWLVTAVLIAHVMRTIGPRDGGPCVCKSRRIFRVPLSDTHHRAGGATVRGHPTIARSSCATCLTCSSGSSG